MQICNINFIKMILIGVSFGIMISVSGCGAKNKWFRDRSNDYKNTESYPNIQIPSGVNAGPFSPDYRIPGY